MYGGSIAFGVDDVEARRTKLEGAGVEFPGESFDSGVCHGAGFTDLSATRCNSITAMRRSRLGASCR